MMKTKLYLRQGGVAALPIALILIFAMTLIAFYVNRSMLSDQRASAAQARATSAFEAAEAGLEWAVSMLNDTRPIDTACSASTVTTDPKFRERYVPLSTTTSSTLDPKAALRPACRIPVGADGVPGAPVCSCPSSPSSTLSGTGASFSVEFAVAPGDPAPRDPAAVRVISRGCTSLGSQCIPGVPFSTQAEAFATVSSILKIGPGFMTLPRAALTVGGVADLNGASPQVYNTDPTADGTTINSGRDVIGKGSLESLPGTPVQNSTVEYDATLDAISQPTSDGSEMFRTFFGTTREAYRTSPATKIVNSEAELRAAYATGFSDFWAASPFLLNDSAPIGSSTRPVTIVSPFDLHFASAVSVYGLVYIDMPYWTHNGTGRSQIFGAVISRDDMKFSGGGTIRYDRAIIENLNKLRGKFARVPGSWRDVQCSSANAGDPCDAPPY